MTDYSEAIQLLPEMEEPIGLICQKVLSSLSWSCIEKLGDTLHHCTETTITLDLKRRGDRIDFSLTVTDPVEVDGGPYK